ncbi:hemicentin-1-like [Formica exsecta]|uniref:hemicentin-1-like n=1 Tax=Formica exsecta TaxID=72781 RepID=UPI001143EB19|nr:hemicentin-1-like [Formica exsecta]
MVTFHGMVLLLLGIGYLLHAEPLYGERGIAFLHSSNDTFGKGEKSQRGTKKTYFFKDTPHKLTVAIGQAAVLLCRVKNLGNRTVSWIRKRDLHILTSMSVTYTSDARFTVVSNPETDYWNLRIDYVQPRDAGIYECQVNTEPKIYRAVTLKVLDIQARITGPQELYIKKGSTISLICSIELQDLPPSNVTWYHAGAVIDFDGPRGGVSLETEKGKQGTTSKLLITRAQFNDSGNYTCASSKVTPASVMVHVLNGEHPAAMQHGGTGDVNRRLVLLVLIFLVDTMFR